MNKAYVRICTLNFKPPDKIIYVCIVVYSVESDI